MHETVVAAPTGTAGVSPRSLALIANSAFSIHNFRGPLVRAWISAGVKVFALAPDFDADSRAAVRALGAEPIDISLDRAGISPGRDFIDTVRLARVLRRLRPDATFGYFIKPVIYGTLAAVMARVPHRYALIAGLGYVYAAEASDRPMRRLLRSGVSMLYRLALRRCNRVFFQNEDDVAVFTGAHIVQAGRAVRVNGTGVELDRFIASAPQSDPPTFLLMARLLRAKGICEFADAARVVRQRFPSSRFLLLGGLDPNPGGLSRAEVESWVSEGLIEWHGHVDDVRPWIDASSVYVLPSYYREGVPRSTQEAMAMGRPVITTDMPGCRDTVLDGTTGFLVPPRDASALAAAMIRFAGDPELTARMGAASRQLAEERFDIHRINRAMLEAMGIPLP